MGFEEGKENLPLSYLGEKNSHGGNGQKEGLHVLVFEEPQGGQCCKDTVSQGKVWRFRTWCPLREPKGNPLQKRIKVSHNLAHTVTMSF